MLKRKKMKTRKMLGVFTYKSKNRVCSTRELKGKRYSDVNDVII